MLEAAAEGVKALEQGKDTEKAMKRELDDYSSARKIEMWWFIKVKSYARCFWRFGARLLSHCGA